MAAWRLLSLLLLLAIWWVVAKLAADPALLPMPLTVCVFLISVIRNGELPWNLAATLARVAAAFVMAMLAGSLLGYTMGRRRWLDALLDQWLVVLLNLPLLVLVVLSYIWIGLNDAAAIFAVILAKAPTIAVTIREGTRALDPELDELAQIFALGRWRRYRQVVLPQLVPYLLAAARSGLAITWKIVLVVELLGRPNGIGFVLNLYFQNFNVAAILAYGLTFALLMLAVEAWTLQPLERRVGRWRGERRVGSGRSDA